MLSLPHYQRRLRLPMHLLSSHSTRLLAATSTAPTRIGLRSRLPCQLRSRHSLSRSSERGRLRSRPGGRPELQASLVPETLRPITTERTRSRASTSKQLPSLASTAFRPATTAAASTSAKPASAEAPPVFTNRFQNLLSFAFEDKKATETVLSKQPQHSLIESASLNVPFLQTNTTPPTERSGKTKLSATSATTIKARGTDKKLTKKVRHGLLDSFKFEERLFGDGSDFFSPIDWNAFDRDMRQQRQQSKSTAKPTSTKSMQVQKKPKEPAPPRQVDVPARVTIRELSERMHVKPRALLQTLRDLGESDLKLDSMITSEIAEVAVESMNMVAIVQPPQINDVKLTVPPSDCSMYPLRPPVVGVMGHVDHGKTTLLDALRSENVAATEAGGITQSIGAFPVYVGDKADRDGAVWTCLDTPGHAAFHAMRSTGSQVTDIIVLVIAAEAGVQSQTKEAVALALERNIPLVVAVTKIDVNGEDRDTVEDRIAKQLLELGVTVESMGGETPLVCVSGKTREGLDQLKETIALHAEVLDLRADINMPGEAVVLESHVNKSTGVQVDAIVHWGALEQGAIFVCGLQSGRVRALVDVSGKRLKRALPGTAVRLSGLRGLPSTAAAIITVQSEEEARRIIEQRQKLVEWEALGAAKSARAQAEAKARREAARAHKKSELKSNNTEVAFEDAALDDGIDEDVDDAPVLIDPREKQRRRARKARSHERAQLLLEAEAEAERIASLKPGEDGYVPKQIPILVRVNAVGMLSAIDDLLTTLPCDEAVVKRIGGGVGPVSSSDIELAQTAGAVIYEFGVRHSAAITQEARIKNVSMRNHSIVYSLLDDISELLQENLDPSNRIEVVGTAEVLQDIELHQGRRIQHAAGCRVTMGTLSQSAKFRVLRDGNVVYNDVSMESMRHFQEKVSEVRKGQECGLAFALADMQFASGDVIEAYVSSGKDSS